jgi:hypothetical protein
MLRQAQQPLSSCNLQNCRISPTHISALQITDCKVSRPCSGVGRLRTPKHLLRIFRTACARARIASLDSLTYPRSIFIIPSWDFDVDIDPIEQGTRDSFLIFCHHRLRTSTGLLCIAIESTRGRVSIIGHIFHLRLRVIG